MLLSFNKNLLYFCLVLCSFLCIVAIPSNNVHAAQPTGSATLDRDNDGVPDKNDKCPDTQQIYKVDPNSRIAPLFESEHLVENSISVPVDAEGCALDSDGDGVPDHQDYCPNDTLQAISAGVTKQGCPVQSDGDGTPDYRDKCPGTPQGIATDRFGCP